MKKEKKKSGRVPQIKKLKYNHRAEFTYEAYGITKDQLDELQKSSLEVIHDRAEAHDGECAASETTQDFMTHFSKAELAIIAANLLHQKIQEGPKVALEGGELEALVKALTAQQGCGCESQEEYQSKGPDPNDPMIR